MYIRLTLAENQLKIGTKYLKQKILQFTFLAVKFSLKGKTEMVSKWIPAESFNPIKPRMGWGNPPNFLAFPIKIHTFLW